MRCISLRVNKLMKVNKNMNFFQNSKAMAVLRILPFAFCLALIAVYFLSGNEFSAEAILSYTPQSPLLAAAVLLLLYAMKSMSIVFPVLALCVASGYIFEPAAAVTVSLLGMAVSLTVSYWFGRFSGKGLVSKLTSKYPKLETVVKWQDGNDFFISFFLRVINSLPLDIVSMYLGASGITYAKYITASMLGAAPGVIAATIIGASITEPDSPAFVFSVAVTVALSVGSAVFYYFYKKVKQRNAHNFT